MDRKFNSDDKGGVLNDLTGRKSEDGKCRITGKLA
jgi:hypothetical protein